MKKRASFIVVGLLSLLFFKGYPQQGDFPTLKGPYLGQKPPGMTPEIFAPGVISTGYHEVGGPAFTPDLSEIYFHRSELV